MKKITDFIIEKRYIILGIFVVFTIISVFLSTKVKINDDITKYLPSTSETRIGMDIMENEFAEADNTSSLNLMFKGLNNEEKNKIYSELKDINGVDSITYDDTENYNKDDYTLYVINVDENASSEIAGNVYNEIMEKYEDYDVYTSGDIATKNIDILPTWIIVVAVGCTLLILILMCESYVEPFLFLTTILIAIILNSGTNIIFDNVSNITNSISAILQLALSMDYSIMLMIRFRQEKETETDKVKAMKNALYHAFQSISSSSLTTIGGLLALVFMSFTIGKDLGFVLAKGVLLSLVSIFFVLPTLILMFDKLISKTQKRTLNIKLGWLGKLSHKLRYVAAVIFIFIFVGSYLLKGNLQILYTSSELDEISEVFGNNNQIAVIYKTEDEEKIAKHLKEIEQKERIDSVLGYSNTINEKLKYNELSEKLKDLGSDVEVDDYLLKILYYKFYNKNEDNKMTFEELSNFIQSEVYNNKNISDTLDNQGKENINKLIYFTNVNEINKERTLTEISDILGISKENVDDILIYYNSKNNNLQLSMNEFVNFVNKDVLTNPKYSANINSEARASLEQLAKFTNKNTIQSKLTSNEMSNLFGIPESTINDLYKYYISLNDIDTKLTLSEFANFVLTDVITNSNYSSSLDENAINNINMLATFSNINIINKQMTSFELSNLFGIDQNIINQLLLLKYMNIDNGTKLRIEDFKNQVIYIKEKTDYLKGVDVEALQNIPNMLFTIYPNEYTATELSKILNINEKQIYNLYAIIDLVNGNTNNWTMNPYEFVNLILQNNSNGSLNLSPELIARLKLLSNIMTSSINKVQYSYKELSNFIGMDETSLKGIYTLYVSSNSNTELTPLEFVNFILNHKDDELLASNLNESTINTIKLLQTIMNGTINNTKYSSEKISSLLGMNKESIDLLYGLYVSKNINIDQDISLNELVSFVLDDVMKNSDYSSNFDEDAKLKLQSINTIMNSSLNNTKYTKDEIFAILGNLTNTIDKETIELLYLYYGSANNYDENWNLTVEQFVKFLNEDILNDARFNEFIDDETRNGIIDSQETIEDAKKLLVGKDYSRLVINTKLEPENDETFNFIQNIKDILNQENADFYVIGDSAMAYEMSKSFEGEFNYISILTMIIIFVVVAVTFKSILVPLTLVLMIQCAVYTTMGFLSITGGTVYFLAILIVQSILMGSTIDYAIVYTSYYLEDRKKYGVKQSIINSYNQSIHTILTSASILIIVTFIIGKFATAITSKICKTLSLGTLCSSMLILLVLPGVLAAFDKIIIRKNRKS